jgi:osmotically-inducible protein OsmY
MSRKSVESAAFCVNSLALHLPSLEIAFAGPVIQGRPIPRELIEMFSGEIMKTKLAVLVASMLLFAGSSWAQGERKDLQVFNDISKTVNRYSLFTIFDDVNASVENGNVTLTGKVTQPFKRDDIEKRVAKVDGVQHVTNRIEVLPVSMFDQELRRRIARSIYGNSNFWNYAIMANPPIHIIVDHGHVTLTGVVQSNVDRMLARSLATQFGAMSVKSELKTEAEVKEQLEKS